MQNILANTNSTIAIKATQDKEKELSNLLEKAEQLENELSAMKKSNAESFSISWINSINTCLQSTDDSNKTVTHFLRTTAFISNCVAYNNGVEVSKSLKNNVASTLSLMFKNKQVGRYTQDGKTFYGLPEYFNKDMQTIKEKYLKTIQLLAA